MAIAPIQTTTLSQVSPTHEAVSQGVSDLANQSAPNSADMDAFSSIMTQAGQNPAAPLSASQQGNLASFIGDTLGGMVDKVASTKKKIETFGKDSSSLSPSGLVKLQRAVEENAITTQVFAKVVSAAAKQIESLTHIQ